MARKRRIIAGVAAAAATTGLAALAAKKRKTGSGKVYRVLFDDDGGGWAVRPEGAARAVSRHPTKKEAVAAAREIAQAKPPSRLVIHKRDGEIQRSHEYGVDRPQRP